MSLLIFDNSQNLIARIKNSALFALDEEGEINKAGTVYTEIKLDLWNNFRSEPFYLAVKKMYSDQEFLLYRITDTSLKSNRVIVEGIEEGYDVLKAHGYVKDRRFDNTSAHIAFEAVLGDSLYDLGYVDDKLPNVNGNLYYLNRLEALSKVVDGIGAEIEFVVSVSGNKISSRRLNVYQQLSEFKGKRFAYGGKLLELVKEESFANIHTAMIGRGKGEEVGDGYGRRLDFKDVEWKKSKGDPVDKPKGQEYVELESATKLYGYPDGVPRMGIKEFTQTEDPEELLRETFESLVDTSRPLAQFRASIKTIGDVEKGETVVIVRPDLKIAYKTRIFKVSRNRLANGKSVVELGDKLTQTMNERIKTIDATIDSKIDESVTIVQNTADGKNKIFRSKIKPTEGMSKNDLWYKELESGEFELYQFDGEHWQPLITAGMNAQIKKAIKDAEDIAKTARARAIDVAEDLDEGTSFFKHSKDIGLASKDADGNINSIIDLQDDGTAYIGGEHIVLDGDTIVDGTFTVTDTIFSENMDISKFTVGTLNGKDVNIINLNVNNIVGNYGNFIKIGMKEANSNLELTGTKLEYTHTKTGNKTVMNADGLFYQDGGSNYRTNYLTHVQNVGKLNHFARNPRWVTLPKVFKGKQFKAFVIPSDTYGVTNDYKYYNLAMLRQVSYISKYDRKNGRVALAGYSYHRDIRNNNRYFKEISVTLVVTY